VTTANGQYQHGSSDNEQAGMAHNLARNFRRDGHHSQSAATHCSAQKSSNLSQSNSAQMESIDSRSSPLCKNCSHLEETNRV
jgi:hypothetical protein